MTPVLEAIDVFKEYREGRGEIVPVLKGVSLSLSRGEIDTRPIVLYLSLTIVMLGLTYQAFQSRKWRL